MHDFERISLLAADLGLLLNRSKSEVICKDHTTLGSLLVQIPGLCVVDPDLATLLGSPIGGNQGIEVEVEKKIESLEMLGERFCHFKSHDAFCLLRHAFSIPKLLHILRSSPCFLCPSLSTFDGLLRSLASEILNVDLNDSAWTQASLPVGSGGLGLRRACSWHLQHFCLLLQHALTSSNSSFHQTSMMFLTAY